MQLILIIGSFMLSSSLIMVGYVSVRAIKHNRSQALNAAGLDEESNGVSQPAEEIAEEYDQAVKKTA